MNIFNRLQRLNSENKIWIIYFFIAAFALLANHYEKDFLLKRNINDYQKEKTIHIVIFLVAFFIYLYFVLVITKDLTNMEKNFNNAKYRNTFLQLIAALLFLIGGAIYLVQEVLNNEIEEIGFI